jgi:hypothetical protein
LMTDAAAAPGAVHAPPIAATHLTDRPRERRRRSCGLPTPRDERGPRDSSVRPSAAGWPSAAPPSRPDRAGSPVRRDAAHAGTSSPQHARTARRLDRS